MSPLELPTDGDASGFYTLVDQNPFGVYVVDAAFRLARVSLGARSVFANIRPLLGRDFAEVLRIVWPEPFATHAIERFRHTLATGEGYIARDATTRGNIDAVEEYDWRIERLTLPDGQLGVVCFFYDLSERARWEHAMRESEARLRMATEAAEVGIWSWHSNTDTVVWENQLPYDILAMTPGEPPVSAARFESEFVLPTFRAQFTEALTASVRERIPLRFEGQVRARNGETRWVELTGTHVSPADGASDRMVGTLRDVTATRTADLHLREMEERAAFVRQSSGVGFWYCDLPFDVLVWDDLVKAHFHLPPTAHVTIDTFYARLHPDDRAPTRDAIARSIAERANYDVEYRTVHPQTGDVTWVRAIGRTAYAADGTPKRFDGITLDVTEKKQAETTLRTREAFIERILHASPSVVYIFEHAEGRTVFINDQVQYLLGLTASELVTRGATFMQERVHPDDLSALQAHIARCATLEDGAVRTVEYRMRHADGRWIWFLSRDIVFLRTEDGAPQQILGVATDISERKRSEDQLRRLAAQLSESDRKKDQFLATLAHELRNPLAPLRNGLELIRMAGVSGPVEHARAMMERQLLQLVRLVDDLLDLSRVTSDKLELRRSTVSVHAIVDAAIETSRPVIDAAAHTLTVTLPEAPMFVHVDVTRIAQSLGNLLHNSAKYTPPGGHIALTVVPAGDWVTITVADDGTGIPPHMLTNVFDMFTQVDRALEKTTGGLGIGLALVKRIVELHDGSIEAQSQGVGHGSAFVLRLPVVSPAGPPPDAAAPHAPLSSRRVLIADDNVDAAESLGHLLTLRGHVVRTAHDGIEALALVAACRPELVLLDIGMPRLNGYEVARRIRAGVGGAQLCLVALTGWSSTTHDVPRSENAFDAHVVKPIDVDNLLVLVDGLMSRTPK